MNDDKLNLISRRDTHENDHVCFSVDVAAFFLEKALKVASQNASPLIDAVYWIEAALELDAAFHNESLQQPSALLKNAGLAHAHLVQNKLIKDGDNGALELPQSYDIFETLIGHHIGWPAERVR